MSVSDEQKQQYNEYVKQVTPTHSLPREMFHAFLTGGAICTLGQHQSAHAGRYRTGSCRDLVFHPPDIAQRSAHRFQCLPFYRQMGRGRRSGSYYRIRQRRRIVRHRIQKRRAGLRHRLQDLHHRRAGDPLRRIHKLGRGAPVLAGQGAGNLKNR